jgi:hypothetical protein
MSQRGDDLNISVELIDAANNKLIWGEHTIAKRNRAKA